MYLRTKQSVYWKVYSVCKLSHFIIKTKSNTLISNIMESNSLSYTHLRWAQRPFSCAVDLRGRGTDKFPKSTHFGLHIQLIYEIFVQLTQIKMSILSLFAALERIILQLTNDTESLSDIFNPHTRTSLSEQTTVFGNVYHTSEQRTVFGSTRFDQVCMTIVYFYIFYNTLSWPSFATTQFIYGIGHLSIFFLFLLKVIKNKRKGGNRKNC